MYFAPTFPLFIDRDPTWKLTKSWELTRTLTNISRISKNLTHSLQIACAYSDIDFAHSRTSQTLLIAPRLVRHWLKLLQLWQTVYCRILPIDPQWNRVSPRPFPRIPWSRIFNHQWPTSSLFYSRRSSRTLLLSFLTTPLSLFHWLWHHPCHTIQHSFDTNLTTGSSICSPNRTEIRMETAYL